MSRIAKLEALLGRVQARRGEPRLVPVASSASSAAAPIELPEPPTTTSFPPESASEARRRSIPSPLELAVEVELDRPAPAPAAARAPVATPSPVEIEVPVDTEPEIDVETDDEEMRTPTVPPPAAAPSARPPGRTSVIDLPAAALVNAPEPERVPVAAPMPSGPVAIAATPLTAPSSPIARVVGDAKAMPQAPATFGELMTRTLTLRLRTDTV